MREQLREEILSVIADLGELEISNSDYLMQIQSQITRIIAVIELNSENGAEKGLRGARERIADAIESIQRDQPTKKVVAQAILKLKEAVELL